MAHLRPCVRVLRLDTGPIRGALGGGPIAYGSEILLSTP